ncbi:MAG: NAD-dependent epimerase/dehydratase family protein [Planctomycetota bacterium]|jgi:dihydroflavonol-4-reductase
MRIVVTGATGLLGNNVVRAACQRGDEVIALARNADRSEALQGLPVTVRNADITDMESLRSAVEGHVDAVVHTAAHIHLGWKDREQSERVNVLGTRQVLALASERGARCVHVSTVNVLPVPDQKNLVDEQSPGLSQVPCTYVLTKKQAERDVSSAMDRGQDIVIVYPGFLLGPWDWKPSSARMILDLRRGAPPMAPAGGCSICDARDVANAILAALQRAPAGSRFILAGENWTYFELWSQIAARLNRPKPWIAMRPPGRWLIGAIGDLLGAVSANEPVFNSAALRMGSQFHWYSSQRARDGLGYESRPAAQSLDDTIAWLRERGKLPSA